MDTPSYVYILANRPYGTLYVGVTVDIVKRITEHRLGVADGFTLEHGIKTLVWYEVHGELLQAITREKRIKKWNRDWKVNLIQGENPQWRDLFDEIAQ
jgi:putative endonuclease